MRSTHGRLLVAAVAVLAATAIMVAGSAAKNGPSKSLDKIDHIVVIYEENHSFDNLYGGWEGINGLQNAAGHSTQVAQDGTPYTCLEQNDVNLALFASGCTTGFQPAPTATPPNVFTNGPFAIDSFIPSSATTCPKPNGTFAAHGFLNGTGLPGGCTADIVHRYYQEQYQIDGGKQDRYVTGSDAVGLTMGHYDTQSLPIYQYLHGAGAPSYAIADNFFQSQFGGSFLNHQGLIAAQPPLFYNALNDGSANDLHSVVDANGMPNNYPLYTSPLGNKVVDGALTASCNPPASRPPTLPGTVCGDYAVNTIQPWYWPYSPGTADAKRLPPQTGANIGDELSAAGVSWAWYSGGWANANGYTTEPGYTNGLGPTCTDPDAKSGSTWPRCPDVNFQYHHQPFNYFQTYAPGTQARADHLKDEAEFIAAIDSSHGKCNLPAVSFDKPVGEENEHPGYTSEVRGSNHLVDLLKAIEGSGCAKNTMVIVTYDEFGGQWDHVSPPSASNPIGPFDQWGPSTRIPALILAPKLPGQFVVDSTEHDTVSILTTIEHRFGVAPLTNRDKNGHDLSSVWSGTTVVAGHGHDDDDNDHQ
jgi:acid phosphatase